MVVFGTEGYLNSNRTYYFDNNPLLLLDRIARDHGHALGSGLVNSVTDYLGATLVGTLEQHRQTLAVG